MAVRIEIEEFYDGRLKMIVRFIQGSNFWIHEDDSCSYVPKKSEIELIKNSLDAIDTFNKFKHNLNL